MENRTTLLDDMRAAFDGDDMKAMRRQLSRAASEIERLRSARKWQPISTALRDDTEILVWNGHIMRIAAYGYDDRWQPEGMPSVVPTHWMPLPQPPEKGER